MPLNNKFPEARNNKMLEVSGAISIDMDSILKEQERDDGQIEITSGEEDTAYLLFTSGTTGIPKGVPVSNKNVCAYLDHVMGEWEFREDDKFSHTFDLTFDLSVHDMFVSWLSGACLCVPEDDSPLKIASYIKEQKISIWFSVPSAAVLMNKMRLLKNANFDTIRRSYFCGEPLPSAIASKWQTATGNNPLVNLYGPSEATIAISAYSWGGEHRKEMNAVVSIGKIFRDQEYILIDTEQLKIIKDKGELCLGGSQVIQGYLKDEELSAKYFIRVEGAPGIWYRTGDMAFKDEDDDLYFLGRKDSEVKISGYRVNLLEIEAIVREEVKGEAAAILKQDNQGIVCFVSGLGKDEKTIMQACKRELPWYMIPERIIFVEEMPLNINGKIDRNKLRQILYGQE
jgi:acyl-coenzyme A synthetase/AMP-(fatty) acid ligase